MREHIVRILGSGYDVTAVTNGMEALQAARETAPDIILSDVMMPELDGFALLKELRADENLRELPVIMLSARAGEEARTEGISAGADDYLTKPFSAKELVARVETTLNLQKTRREARAEIAQSEMRFRAFVTATSEVVYRMSPDWMEMRYLDGRNFIDDTANPSRSWLEKYIHPEDQARVLAAIEKAIQSKTLFELEHRVIRVDGTLGWTFSRAVPILNDDGAIVEWFGAAKDVSEHKAAKEALEAANAALMQSNADLEQFAYSASHDLQEPLRMVATYSELLKREFGGKLGSEGDEFIGYTLQGALRIQQLLKDLRTYTLVSTDRQKPAVDADADAVMDRALTNLHTAIHDSGAVITRGPMPRVRIGEIQLEQLFQNLIGNSIRYRAAETPRIHVAAEEQGSVWLFSVKDNGIGIDPQYKEHIFGMFKRLHGAAEYPGTGMGLAICQRIVERAGGRIWVESEPARGSTFYFTVPREIA
jgi:signal transduction histidine kinase